MKKSLIDTKMVHFYIFLDFTFYSFSVPDIRLPVSQVWSPDVEVYNGISQELTTKTDNVVIDSR